MAVPSISLPRAARRSEAPPGLQLLLGVVLTSMSWLALCIGLWGLIDLLVLGVAGLAGAVVAVTRGLGRQRPLGVRAIVAVLFVLGPGALMWRLWLG